jgi:uncharacterized protein YkwD
MPDQRRHTGTARRARSLVALLPAFVILGSLAPVPALATARGNGLRSAANEERTSRDVARVAARRVLDSIATARGRQMADAAALEHNMTYVRRRLRRAGVCWTRFGEIIAGSQGQYSYGRTIGQWLDSDLHRSIMLDRAYHVAGGSWATDADGRHYSVMIFVRLCSR